MKPHLIEVTVSQRGGRYVATCEARKLSGYGATEKEALESLRKEISATIKVRAVSRGKVRQAALFEDLDEDVEFLLFYASRPSG